LPSQTSQRGSRKKQAGRKKQERKRKQAGIQVQEEIVKTKSS
jgi:hypothetical protein